MLEAFLTANRQTIIDRTRARVASRSPAAAPERLDLEEVADGIPDFLTQLGEALGRARQSDVIDHVQMSETATKHGGDLLRMGLSVRQVVNDYGDVCQTITDLAIEQRTPFSSQEFRTLNLCLDDAIAAAVTEYARLRERDVTVRGTERLGILAHEMRNLLQAAMLSFDNIKSGRVALNGSTGALHQRSLNGLRDLIDLSLADVRLDAGVERAELISVAELVEEIDLGQQFQAQARQIVFSVASVDRSVAILGDRHIIAAAVANLLQNAFKFTPKLGKVWLAVSATDDRVLFRVEDECGGLPPGRVDDLLRPFEQRGTDRSGIGLGLSICLKAAQTNHGALHAHDLPGKGCVFTLDLPRSQPHRVTDAANQEETR